MTCLADRLGRLVALTDAECVALGAIGSRERTLRRGSTLQRAQEPVGEVYVLKQGMLMSYLLTGEGSRQIVCFHFAGDMVGMANLTFRAAPEAIAALTDATVVPVERAALGALIAAHPRLGALLLADAQLAQVALAERLAALGRLDAKGRVAGVLVELDRRLRASGDTGFPLALTQEEIGDATGLTAVHVNRMLRQLAQEGLIAREGGRVRLVDEAALARAAGQLPNPALDLGWLPPAAPARAEERGPMREGRL